MKKIFFLVMSAVLLVAAPPKFLMPDEAFIPHAKIDDAMQINAKIELAKDIYVYEDKVSFEIKDAQGISIKDIQTPSAQEHHEDMVYLSSPSFVITLHKSDGTEGVKTVNFEMSYQGCSEQGLCYEPLSKTFTFDVDTAKLSVFQKDDVKEQKSLDVALVTSEAAASTELSEVDSIAQNLATQNIFLSLLTLFGIGLLLSLTPCVFPMIPIISGVIVSQGEGLTTRRAFFLSVVYVFAMAVAYTIAGVLAGMFGSNLQASLQNPYVIYAFAGIFVALALSMFGFYELKLPDSIVSRVSSSTNRGGVAGVAIMGFLSALIVGPCVAAPLAGVLVYIGQTGDALFGGMALFSLSIGMGVPLIVVGVGAGKFMPKPGHWMTMVTAIFGVMMLAIAIWMLERVVEPYVSMLLWSMLGIGFAIYLGAFEKDTHVFKRSVAVITLLYSIALFIGTLGGSESMSRPLEFLKPQTVYAGEVKTGKKAEFLKITSIAELDKLLEENKGKKILLDFSADWCAVCKELEKVTFSDSAVKAKMAEFVLIKADVTLNGEQEKALSSKYGVFGPPAILFFDKDSKLIKSKSIIGFIEPQAFLAHLNQI